MLWILLRAAAWSLLGMCALAQLGWLYGRFVTDAHMWSRFLWWMPTLLVLPAGVIGVVAARLCGGDKQARRTRTIAMALLGAVPLLWFTLHEYRIFRAAPQDPSGLKIVHWTIADPSINPRTEPFAQRIIEMNGDLTVLTNSDGAAWHPSVKAWIEGQGRVLSVGPFAVVTRREVTEARWIAGADRIVVALLVLEPGGEFPRPLNVMLVDLPSNPDLSRIQIGQKLREILETAKAPVPDIVVGDFNMTRGSASLREAFPEMRHAFESGGHGYGATFPRQFPLFHIDHILISREITCERYDFESAPGGRHRPHAAWLEWAGEVGRE